MNLNIVFKSLNKLEKYFKKNNLDLKNILLHSDKKIKYFPTLIRKIFYFF